ncbi:SseB family protein [Porcincola intestinalis]|uniref:SseB family protein n=1 Tax=Porcincola intestinalis TaxID=2606632 RepID=UPI002A7F93A8|nr:SseB family protein [Porcincola intestinalis]MDY4205357.1 SseB family protein [Porcincola intestinalis]
MAIDQAFIIQQIKKKETLYAAFCMNTKMPFIICDPDTYNDQVWIFDGEDELKKFVEEYAQKKYLIRGAKMEQKQFGGFFASLYTLDVNEIVYVSDDAVSKIALSDLVKRLDFSNLPPLQRPVENPSLQLSGLYFMQEATRQIPNEEKKNLSELNEEFSANLAAARYIVAVIPKEGPGTLPEKLQQHEFSVPVLNMKNGKKFVPCFSDQFEYDKFRQNQKLLELAVPLPGLMQYAGKDTDGFMLNPMGMSMVLTKELIEALVKAFPDRIQEGIQKANEIVRQAQEYAKKTSAIRKNAPDKKPEEKRKEVPVSHLPGHSKVLTPSFASRGRAEKEAAPAPVYRPVKKMPKEQEPSGKQPDSASTKQPEE